MFLRQPPTKTLVDVRNDIETPQEGIDVPVSEVQFDLTGDRVIRLNDQVEVPATPSGIKAFGDWLEVPSKFLERIDADLQQHILATMVQRQPNVARVFYHDTGVEMLREPGQNVIDPRRIVEVAMSVIDRQAPVLDFWADQNEFRLDVTVPEDFDRGIGGDKPKGKSVGDITLGGLRFGMDIKHNLAPWVAELMYRLACTNGYERADENLRVEGRGNTVDEVLVQLEQQAQIAFGRVENTIESFYDLRSQPVENPERTVIRLGEEGGLPARTTFNLAERVPAMIEHENPTMFDIVNLVTNQANDPSMKAGPRRNLQRLGGHVIADHADRCAHCLSKLN